MQEQTTFALCSLERVFVISKQSPVLRLFCACCIWWCWANPGVSLQHSFMSLFMAQWGHRRVRELNYPFSVSSCLIFGFGLREGSVKSVLWFNADGKLQVSMFLIWQLTIRIILLLLQFQMFVLFVYYQGHSWNESCNELHRTERCVTVGAQ